MREQTIFLSKKGEYPSKQLEKAFEKDGISVNGTSDASCSCGHGCAPYRCKKSVYFWLSVPVGCADLSGKAVREIFQEMVPFMTAKDKEIFKDRI